MLLSCYIRLTLTFFGADNMTNAHIPSNFTLAETLKLHGGEIPYLILQRIESLIEDHDEKILEIETELTEANKRLELISEQNYFKEQLLEEILELCKCKGKKADLVKSINKALEDSYVEL